MMERVRRLPVIIREHAPILRLGMPWADPEKVLLALVAMESAGGRRAVPRHEKSYDRGGKWFNADLARLWGSWAACSYSSFQIMYPVAVELGFDPQRSPGDLHDDEVAIHWVLAYIQKRIIDKGATSVRDFADAYNSGSHRDSFVPVAYVNGFVKAYKEAGGGPVST